MSAGDLIARHRKLFEHEKDATRRVLESLDSVPGAQRNKLEYHYACDRTAHLLLTRLEWLDRVLGDRSEACANGIFPEDVSLDHLQGLREQVEQRWDAYLAKLDDTELSRDAQYTNTAGEKYTTPVADILDHVYTHGFYHRGQVASAVSACGGERAMQDYILYVRDRCG
ncbi:MAG: DinB family protein [Planctomycetota bacterium]